MDIDYNKLKFFLAVVRCKSLTAAAKELHRTQSAVSQAISSFERQLGVKLLTWEGKRLQLTREGKLIYNAAADRIASLDEQFESITKAGLEVGGVIEIGMLNDASTDMQELVFAQIAQFRSDYPAVTFKIRFDTSRNIEEALLQRELDLGFLINIQSHHRFHAIEVATEQHIIVSSPQYVARFPELKTVQDVISKDLIDIDEHFTCFTPWVSHHDADALGILEKKSPVIAVPDFRLIQKLVLDHQGIAVLPRYLISKELERGSIIQLLPELSALRVWVNCIRERGRQDRLCEQLFIEKFI